MSFQVAEIFCHSKEKFRNVQAKLSVSNIFLPAVSKYFSMSKKLNRLQLRPCLLFLKHGNRPIRLLGFSNRPIRLLDFSQPCSNTGCPKNLLESGAHKTPIRDTFTWCAGCSHIGFSFLGWGQIDEHCWSNLTSQLIIQCCRRWPNCPTCGVQQYVIMCVEQCWRGISNQHTFVEQQIKYFYIFIYIQLYNIIFSQLFSRKDSSVGSTLAS